MGAGRDLLRAPEPRSALLGAVAAGVDRLVLLGDVIELRQGPTREALAAGEETLRELGAAVRPGCRVVITPGNHDHMLVAPWLERRARRRTPTPIGLSSAVDWRAGEPLARIASWLGSAELEVAYPGLWLRDDVYATHGHYADRHTTVPQLERLAAGAMARIMAGPGDPRSTEDYERVLGPMYAWIDAVAQVGGPPGAHGASGRAWRALSDRGRGQGWRGRMAAAAFPGVIAALNRIGLGPLDADLSGPGVRRAQLRSLGEVLLALRVSAPYVIFGHTHRAGPLPADDLSEWRALTGSRLMNSGCWVREPSFLGSDPRSSPYRAGFCVTVEDHGPPVLSNLLDE